MRPSATLADDAQALLASALQCARVTRFEVTEPTLEEIFIEKVRETSPVKEILEPEPGLSWKNQWRAFSMPKAADGSGVDAECVADCASRVCRADPDQA